MSYFTPIWHPTDAKNDFTLFNNLNQTNNILYYDTTTTFIEYPKIFTFKRKDNDVYNLKLDKVVTNTNSNNPTYSQTMPATEGKFTINKIAPDDGSNAPSIDLYCSGKIIQDIDYYLSFGSSWPSALKEAVDAGYETQTFTISNDTFPKSGYIRVKWNHGKSWVEPDYYDWNGSRYTFYIAGDYISVTTNWNNNRISTQNASGDNNDTIKCLNGYEGNNGAVPTIYCRWGIIMGFNRTDIPHEYSKWTGYVVNTYAWYNGVWKDVGLVVRNSNGDPVGSLWFGNSVTVIDEDNGWYKIGDNRWVDGDYISKEKPSGPPEPEYY